MRLSKERVLNLARAHINLPPLATSDQQQVETMYELLKTSLLEERPWPFALAITDKLQTTKEGDNLNYQYRYKLPADALDVISLNPNQTGRSVGVLSNYDSIRIGIAPNDEDVRTRLSSASQKFYFKNGILYTNVKTDEVLYKRDPEEKEFSTDFMLALSWYLAKYLAISIAGTPELAGYCAREGDAHHARAYRTLNRLLPGIDQSVIDSWIRQYFGRIYWS